MSRFPIHAARASLFGWVFAILLALPASLSAAETGNMEERAATRIRPALVEVSIEVLEDPAAAYEARSPIETVLDNLVRQHIALRVAGLRVTPAGEVLIRDPLLPLDRYGSVSIRDHEGHSNPARVAAVLQRHAAILLRPENPPEKPVECLTFASTAIPPATAFLLAEPAFHEQALHLRVWSETTAFPGVPADPRQQAVGQGLRALWWLDNEAGRRLGRVIPVSAFIVLTAEAEPVGVLLDDTLWEAPEGRRSWVGADLAQERRIEAEEFAETRKKLQERALASVKEIEITFRADSPLIKRLPLEDGRLFVYGILLNRDGAILVPGEFGRDVIAQVEKIAVREGDQTLPAKFEGAFSEFGALMISVPKPSGEPVEFSTVREIPRGDLFYTLSTQRRYGRREDRVDYDRSLDTVVGYKETLSPTPLKFLRVGDYLLDEQGRFMAFLAPLKQEKRDELHARLVRQSAGAALQNRIFLFSEVLDQIRNPKASYDPSVQLRSPRDERRTVWLGVECQSLTPALARALKAETATRDGARGLLVTHVYAPSPAQKAGLVTGDILLAVEVPGSAREFDLMPRGEWRNTPFAAGPVDGPPQRLWRPRRDFLTELLRMVGEGNPVAIRRLHQGAEDVLKLVIEKAPDDFDTTEEYNDPALGLSVKALTYEVRYALRLAADAPGVVVSRVEPGSRANVAQVRPFEIIASVNDQPVRTPKEFERLIRERASTGQVELLLIHLSQSRIVELDLDGD